MDELEERMRALEEEVLQLRGYVSHIALATLVELDEPRAAAMSRRLLMRTLAQVHTEGPSVVPLDLVGLCQPTY